LVAQAMATSGRRPLLRGSLFFANCLSHFFSIFPNFWAL
jgi:hypothetical protein